ncbi:hypothetical protein EK21DRAFT_119708 [Setomelanomma holmii]|uniref:Uncharacterized protein n=1 Tax=Setomelanomma holmii TaxID=210430 RepID=A0A9P4GWH8_9PLEO|nr:hypothetical protein EK21DRAFT_119708 [Setomelanomma holmii]
MQTTSDSLGIHYVTTMQFKLPLGLISYSHLGSSATVNSKASDDSSGQRRLL